jgi:hypothetical protein
MIWKTVPNAARVWVDGRSPKILYKAIRQGKLEAARIGAGRNLMVNEDQIDRWLQSSVRKTTTTKIVKLA